MMKRLLFTILALCGLFVGLQAQNTNTSNQKGVTSQGQLDTVRNTRVQNEQIQGKFVDQFGKTGQRPGLSPYGQRLNAIIKITSSNIVSNSVSATTATIAATVSDSGDYALPIIKRGVCYATAANPTLLTATKKPDNTISGKGFGNFNVSLSGLNPNTEYHARAYAVSLYDTVYGEDLTFTTLFAAGTISYTTSTVEKTLAAPAFTNPLTKVGDGTVTYALSAGDIICTVNATTGAVTLNGIPGTCTITATVTNGSSYTYATNTASYTLTVVPVLDLSMVTANITVPDGVTVTGTLSGKYKISIADDATVTLRNVTINHNNKILVSNYKFAGINCLGDATIILADGTTNTVRGFYENYPGIHVPSGYTLTINGETAGTGSLTASSNGSAAGIGCGWYHLASGNIIINGGIITATGGKYGAGIGSGGLEANTCGNITINGGTVTATGGERAAGIGAVYNWGSCGDITINGGTVTATGQDDAAGIGGGYHYGNCGNITIANTVTRVTATKGPSAPNSIGGGDLSSCGTVTFGDAAINPSSVTAGNHGGLTLAISTTTNTNDTWTLTPTPPAPSGAIDGLFSVSSTKQVYFSQGNLQATTINNGSTWTWAFAAHQWDYIGNAVANNSVNGNGTVATNGTVDLFGWSTAATTFGIHNGTHSSYYSGDFVDWGSNIGTGWRTLTSAEWEYLFITRTSSSSVNGTSNARYAHATINTDGTSVNGLILFPDGVTIASNEATSWGNINATSTWANATKCTSAQWTALAAKGCVFLPTAGLWFASVDLTGTNGCYWSSSPLDQDQSRAHCIEFLSTYLLYGEQQSKNRGYGLSVRLVRDAN